MAAFEIKLNKCTSIRKAQTGESASSMHSFKPLGSHLGPTPQGRLHKSDLLIEFFKSTPKCPYVLFLLYQLKKSTVELEKVR